MGSEAEAPTTPPFPSRKAVERGAEERLVPILMTAMAAGLALIPLALGGGQSGSEIQTPMAIVNRDLAGVETVFLLPNPANAHVSSSLVRQVAALGGDVSPYVPRAVYEYLQEP